MGPSHPNRPPDLVIAVRRINYSGEALYESALDVASGGDDVVVGLPDIIDLVLDYAVEDINNSALNFEVIAVWKDEYGNDIASVVYDNSGYPIEWTVANE